MVVRAAFDHRPCLLEALHVLFQELSIAQSEIPLLTEHGGVDQEIGKEGFAAGHGQQASSPWPRQTNLVRFIAPALHTP